jgi:predicted negative regulator of RcsB-dependent stress response
MSLCAIVLFDFDHFSQALVEIMIFVLAAVAFLGLRDWLEYTHNDHRPRWQVYQDALEATQTILNNTRIEYTMAKLARDNLLESTSRLAEKQKNYEATLSVVNNNLTQAQILLTSSQAENHEKDAKLAELLSQLQSSESLLKEKTEAISELQIRIESLKIKRFHLVDV